MSDAHTPTDGARLLLELVADAGTRATYRAAIFTAERTFEGTATLADDGGVELVLDAPAGMRETLEILAKLTARAAAKKRADGLAPWPARVLRWRGPGRGE